jgi:hypothetical protein
MRAVVEEKRAHQYLSKTETGSSPSVLISRSGRWIWKCCDHQVASPKANSICERVIGTILQRRARVCDRLLRMVRKQRRRDYLRSTVRLHDELVPKCGPYRITSNYEFAAYTPTTGLVRLLRPIVKSWFSMMSDLRHHSLLRRIVTRQLSGSRLSAARTSEP